MELFITAVGAGIAVGSIYGLVGLSLCAIFNASRVINFAQGEFAMLGAFVGMFIFRGDLPLYFGIPLVIALPVVFGIGLNYFLAEPLVRAGVPVLAIVLILLGGGLTATGIVGGLTDYGWFDTRMLFGMKSLGSGVFHIAPQNLAIIVATFIMAGGYWLLLNRTNIGMAIRATGIDAEMASTVGMNLGAIRLLTWVISALICGIAGFLVAPIMMPSALLGVPLLVNGFIAAVFGGFGEPFLALGGGLILGLFTSLFATYVSPGHSELVMLVAMLAVLAFRPGGLLMRRAGA